MHMTMDPAARASARDAVQSLRERMAALQAGTIAAPTPEPGQPGASSCIFPKIFRGYRCDIRSRSITIHLSVISMRQLP